MMISRSLRYSFSIAASSPFSASWVQVSLLSSSSLSVPTKENSLITERGGEEEGSVFPKVGSLVSGSVLKTHFLGVLLNISPLPSEPESSCSSLPSSSPLSSTSIAPSSKQLIPSTSPTSLSSYRVTSTALLPHEEIRFYRKASKRDIRRNQEYSLYVHRVTLTDDGDRQILVSFRPPGLERLQSSYQTVLRALNETENGRIPVGQASDATAVENYFPGMSKSDFKKALGRLFKEHRIMKPSGKKYTLLNDEETRLDLIDKEERIESEKVEISLKNLPLDIKTESIAQHVLRQINICKYGARGVSINGDKNKEHSEAVNVNEKDNFRLLFGDNGKPLRSALKGIDIHIANIVVSKKRDKCRAQMVFDVSAKASRFSAIQQQLKKSDRKDATTHFVSRLLHNFYIGQKVGVVETCPPNDSASK